MRDLNTYKLNHRNAIIAIAIIEVLFWLGIYGIYHYVSNYTSGFRLERTWVLYLFGFIPLLLVSYLLMRNWTNKAFIRYADYKLLPLLSKGKSNGKSILKFILSRLGLSFVIIAMANPQFGENEREVESKGIDIMIAVDISNSMKAEDLKEGYSRLKIAKLNIEKFIERLHGDHIGIVLFAGDAYKHLPITPDYHMAKTFTQTINTRLMSSQGTDIGLAIEKCMSSFDFENGANKAIVIFSDGEDHEELGIEAAKTAQDKGVVIHTIGMASTEGVPIPIYRNGKKIGNKKDQNGNTVLTKLNESLLIEVASAGGGSYSLANGLNVGLEGLMTEISKITKSTLAKDRYSGYDDQFQVFLLIGIILLLLESIISDNNGYWINSIIKANHE